MSCLSLTPVQYAGLTNYEKPSYAFLSSVVAVIAIIALDAIATDVLADAYSAEMAQNLTLYAIIPLSVVGLLPGILQNTQQIDAAYRVKEAHPARTEVYENRHINFIAKKQLRNTRNVLCLIACVTAVALFAMGKIDLETTWKISQWAVAIYLILAGLTSCCICDGLPREHPVELAPNTTVAHY